MPIPQVSDWRRHEAILSSDRKGFNPLRDLYGILCAEYPWLSEWKLGFCVPDEVAEWRSQGWAFLEVSHLSQEGLDNFNKAISLKFGMTSSDGHVKHRDNFLMIMPKEFRDKQVGSRNERSERQFRQEQDSRGYVAPGDRGGTTESSYEEEQITVNSEGTPKKKRGRPKGSKNKPKG